MQVDHAGRLNYHLKFHKEGRSIFHILLIKLCIIALPMFVLFSALNWLPPHTGTKIETVSDGFTYKVCLNYKWLNIFRNCGWHSVHYCRKRAWTNIDWWEGSWLQLFIPVINIQYVPSKWISRKYFYRLWNYLSANIYHSWKDFFSFLKWCLQTFERQLGNIYTLQIQFITILCKFWKFTRIKRLPMIHPLGNNVIVNIKLIVKSFQAAIIKAVPK